MSVAAAAKAFLVGAEGVVPGLLAGLTPKVAVSYSEPRDILRDVVYAGDVSGSVDLSAMAAGGRVKRVESLSFPLVVRVYKPNGDTREATDARADEIGDLIADYIAANWTFGDLDDLKKATVSAIDLSGWVDDDGAGSILTMTVDLMSYRT